MEVFGSMVRISWFISPIFSGTKSTYTILILGFFWLVSVK